MTTHPEVLWAQRSSITDATKNIIYITINVTGLDEESVKWAITSTTIEFNGQTKERKYRFKLDLFAEIIPDLSTSRTTSRAFTAVLRKKESRAEYWERLTEQTVRLPYVKTDFGKWVDEDEQEGEPVASFDEDGFGGGAPGGMDFGNMMSQFGGGQGGMPDFSSLGGGYGPDDDDDGPGSSGAKDDDSDDDGPPPLEEVPAAAK